MTTKIGYFTAGTTPTATETAEITKLLAISNPDIKVAVRNGDGEHSWSYGHGVEDFDLVAGTIPTAFSGETETNVANASCPLLFKLYCQAATVAAASTLTLIPVKITGTNVLALTSTQMAPNASGLAWSNGGADAVATVANGVITGVGAGSATITCTYTYDTGKTIVATFAVTVTA